MSRTYAGAKKTERLATLNAQLAGLLDVVEGADAAPTPQAIAAVASIEREITSLHK
jgi:hypothetical protein